MPDLWRCDKCSSTGAFERRGLRLYVFVRDRDPMGRWGYKRRRHVRLCESHWCGFEAFWSRWAFGVEYLLAPPPASPRRHGTGDVATHREETT